MSSEAGFVFGSSFSWIPIKLDNLLSYDLYLSHDTCNTEVCLGFGPYPTPGLYNYLAPACITTSPSTPSHDTCNTEVCFYFQVAEVQKISPSFLVAHIHLSLYYGSTWLHCRSSLCFLYSCCTWWVLRLHSP
jgi:hypothetical protein